MSLKYELMRLERANKANPNKEKMLLEVCKRYMPEKKKSALVYISIVEMIDRTWRMFAQEHHLNAKAFKQWVVENNEEARELMKW